MTKKELVDAIAAETGLTKAKVNAFFKSFTETAISVLAEGEVLVLDGFGELAPAKEGRDVDMKPDPALLSALGIEAETESAPETASEPAAKSETAPESPVEAGEEKPEPATDSCEDLMIRNWYKTYWTGC